MTINIDELKKKIIYRSNYRGTKEMDKLLGTFTKKNINYLNYEDLIDLEKLLNIDDTNLYNFYTGAETCLLYTSPSPRDLSTSRMPSSA